MCVLMSSPLKERWTEAELEALTEFVLFHTSGDKWPSHKQQNFWSAASKYVKQRLGAIGVTRSG